MRTFTSSATPLPPHPPQQSRRRQWVVVSLALTVGFLLLIAGIYLFSRMVDFDILSATMGFLILGIPVALVAVFLPMFLLKRLAGLSRRVEGDASEMDFSHFADAQPVLRYEGEDGAPLGHRPARRRALLETGRYA